MQTQILQATTWVPLDSMFLQLMVKFTLSGSNFSWVQDFQPRVFSFYPFSRLWTQGEKEFRARIYKNELKKLKHNNCSLTFGVFFDFCTITGLLESTCEWKIGWMDRLTFANFRIFRSDILWKPDLVPEQRNIQPVHTFFLAALESWHQDIVR